MSLSFPVLVLFVWDLASHHYRCGVGHSDQFGLWPAGNICPNRGEFRISPAGNHHFSSEVDIRFIPGPYI